MIFRSSFISNSSSSSYIVIEPETPGDKDYAKYFFSDPYYIGLLGTTKFDCKPDSYSDVDTKINWLYLQALYADQRESEINLYKSGQKELFEDEKVSKLKQSNKYTSIVINLLEKYTNVSIIPKLQLDNFIDNSPNMYIGYIDHQSTAYEAPGQAEIFKSEDQMISFIFNPLSYIVVDNDNH